MRTFNQSISLPFVAFACLFPVSGFAENPWITPNRSSFPFTEEEYAELDEMMNPCSDDARQTFPQVARRFGESDDDKSTLYVMVRTSGVDDKPPNFFLNVRKVEEGSIAGRIATDGVVVDGRRYRLGKKFTADISSVIDWLIVHEDRPEEGNLLGRYLLLRQDGLMSGPCDPSHRELRRSRIFRETYSFAPPEKFNWKLRGGLNDLEVSLFKPDSTGSDMHAAFVGRYSSCELCENSDDIVNNLKSLVESKEIVDAKGFALTSYEVMSFDHPQASCAELRLISKGRDLESQQSGQQVIVTREILEIACIHPWKKDEGITLGYIHHYVTGARDPDLDSRVAELFESLAFSRLN
jgi:hypothetical protein